MNDTVTKSYLALDQHFDPASHVFVIMYIEFEGTGANDIANAIAGESSIGSWKDLPRLTDAIFSQFAARVVTISDETTSSAVIKIAYPIGLFELDNIPQLLSTITGNIYGLSGLVNLHVRDVELPKQLLGSHKGPALGVYGTREVLKVDKRALLSTVIKPRVGLPTADYVQAAYESWVGGMDIVKDDPHLTDQDINPFYDRVSQMIAARRKAEDETGEKKLYCPNISARMSEMYARAKFVREMGGRAVLVDILTVGFSGLQFIREQELGLAIHGHRAMHGAFTHSKHHGISMLVIAKLARLAGVDQLHTGTIAGNMGGGSKDVIAVDDALRANWDGIKPTFPIASGGIDAEDIGEIINTLGENIIINVGGGIQGHPKGVTEAAKIVRSAIENPSKSMEKEAMHESRKTYTHTLVTSKGLELTERK